MNKSTTTTVASALATFEDKIGGKFKPNQVFYDRVQINRKRFGQILRGEKPMFGYEVRALADFFGIPPTDLLCWAEW